MQRSSLAICLLLLAGAIPAGATDHPELPPAKLRWQDLPETTTPFQPASFATLTEWETRRAWLKGQIQFAAGLWPEPVRTPLRPEELDLLDRGTYTISKVCFESMPGLLVTGNLYRPKKVPGKAPAVLMLHGHWPRGRLQHDETCSIPAACVTLARLGTVVLVCDMVGFNDSRHQIEHVIDTPQLALWGISSMGLEIWNGIRGLDLLQSLPEVDRQRLGIVGIEAGGMHGLLLTALDDRVKAVAAVCAVSASMQGGCPCENAPGLRIDTNNMELAACVAPRPALFVSASEDHTRNTPTVEFPMIHSIYELYGQAKDVRNVHIEGPTNFNQASRAAVYQFLAQYLLGKPGGLAVTESPFTVESDEDLLCFREGDDRPARAHSASQLLNEMITAAQAKLDSMSPTNPRDLGLLSWHFQAGLMHAISSELPRCEQVQVIPKTDKPFFMNGWLSEEALRANQEFVEKAGFPPYPVERYYVRNQRAVRTFQLDTRLCPRPRGGITIFAHPEGVAIAEQMEAFVLAAMSKQKPDTVVFVEPFGVGELRLPGQPTRPIDSTDSPTIAQAFEQATAFVGKARGTTAYFTTFNRTDLAEATYDLATILGVLLADYEKLERVNLVGFDVLGPAMLMARAVIPDWITETVPVVTVVDLQQLDVASDEVYLGSVNLPGIRRLGGLQCAAGVATGGPAWFHNVGPAFPSQWVQSAAQTHGARVRITQQPADLENAVHWIAAQKWTPRR